MFVSIRDSATVQLMEVNQSGVGGEIQLVQNLESNHVMITGTVRGLAPGIHGIHLQHGNNCVDNVSI